MRSISSLILIATLLPALAGCQTKSVSLDEAKQITATFEGSTFTPPPRTIKDITAILDEQKLSDPRATAKARAEATQEPPPETSDADTLAKFYENRALAALDIGRTEQTIADYRRALKFAQRAGADASRVANLLYWLGHSEYNSGNLSQGFKHLRESLAKDPRPLSRAIRSAVIASYYALAGDLAAAEELLKPALNQYLGDVNERTRLDMAVFIARAQASVLELKGRLTEAESYYRQATAHKAEVIRLHLRPGKRGKQQIDSYNWGIALLADNLRRQGRLVEAEIEARKAMLGALQTRGCYTENTAHVLWVLSRVIFEQGRYRDAESLARANVEIYEKIGASADATHLAKVRMRLAAALFVQGRWHDALEVYGRIRAALASDPYAFQRHVAGDPNRALALLAGGRAEEAQDVARAAYERSMGQVGGKHYNSAEALGILAAIQAASGDRRGGLAAFSKAVPILLSRSRQIEDEESTQAARERRLEVILESYIGLLADIHGTALEGEAGVDAVAEAFRLADIVRSGAVQRALTASAARATTRDPELADLARREQDTQKQIAANYGQFANMLSRPTDQQDAKVVESLRVRIDRLRGARAALMGEIEARFPDYAELINPKPVTIEDARATLAPGEAMISTYVGRERTYVWAVPKRGAVTFAAVDLGREDLTDQVVLLRGALEPAATTLGDIPAFDLSAAHDLYRRLLEPVKAGWGEAESLLIVAHGPLGYLPMSILPTESVVLGPEREPLFANYRDVPWLARTHAVTMLPSVASLKTLRGLPPGDDKRLAFAGFGDPWFSPEQAASAALPQAKPQQVAALASRGIKTRGLRLRAAPKTTEMNSAELARLPRLPDTAEEVESIAVALNANLTESVFLGREANEDRIKTMNLSGYKVLAFATHGLVPGDLNGLVQPALALTSPQVSGGSEDGLLTMGEILGLKLDADWVVLSACNTGSGQGAGAEAVSGLGRAFFYAGTRALLVSNWPVETTSAKALTTDLFKRQADDPGLTRAQALRQAMVGLIDGPGFRDPASGKVVFSYAHPLFWAPFSLIGNGGGGRPAS